VVGSRFAFAGSFVFGWVFSIVIFGTSVADHGGCINIVNGSGVVNECLPSSAVGAVTGGNPHHYVGNDPLNHVDPSGMGRVRDGGTGGFSAGVRQWGCENPLAETAVGMLPGVGCAYSMAKWEGLDIAMDCLPGLLSKMKSAFKAARALKRVRAEARALPGLKSAADDLIEGAIKNTNILDAGADEGARSKG
jgi:hypothetical protein